MKARKTKLLRAMVGADDGYVMFGLSLGWFVIGKSIAPKLADDSDDGRLYPYMITDFELNPNDPDTVLARIGWWRNNGKQ